MNKKALAVLEYDKIIKALHQELEAAIAKED